MARPARAEVQPQWTPHGGQCVRCAYSLSGLGKEGQCPECGEVYFERQLSLTGVPSHAASGKRRVLWIVIIVLFAIHSQTWWLLGFRVAGCVTLGLLGAAVGMALTSKRERSGRERFVISPGGICRVPFERKASTEADSLFVPWGGADAVMIKRVSSVWRKIQIGQNLGGTLVNPVFEAGFYCPDDQEAFVRAEIEGFLAGNRVVVRAPEPSAEQGGGEQAVQ